MTTTHRTHRLRRSVAAGFLAAASLVGLFAESPAQARTAESTSLEARTEATAARTTARRRMSRNQQIVANQINRTRTSRARRSLRTDATMNARAQNWARYLRSCQCLRHRAPPYGLRGGWCAAAENVGRSGNGGTLRGVHNAFMRSSGHRANILNQRWTRLGVGVARDQRGEYFVVHVFADYSC